MSYSLRSTNVDNDGEKEVFFYYETVRKTVKQILCLAKKIHRFSSGHNIVPNGTFS